MAGESTHGEKGHSGGMSMYVRFMAMIGTSTAVMFGLMYLNTYSIDHVFWRETRFWMAFVMGAAMMVVMLAFLWGMYKDRTKNFSSWAWRRSGSRWRSGCFGASLRLRTPVNRGR